MEELAGDDGLEERVGGVFLSLSVGAVTLEVTAVPHDGKSPWAQLHHFLPLPLWVRGGNCFSLFLLGVFLFIAGPSRMPITL